MNVVVLTPWLPYPLVFGGAIRIYHMLQMLASFSHITLVTYKSWTEEDSAAHLRTICERVEVVDAKPPGSTLRQALSMATRHSYQHLSHRSGSFQRVLDDVVKANDFDVAMVEMTPMAQFRLPSGAVRILDLANIEHELVERRASVTGGRLRATMLRQEARKVRREELAACGRFDLLLTTSQRETDIVRSWSNEVIVETMPNTVDTRFFAARAGQRRPGARLAFIGATHVDANHDGLRWFIDEVFPLVELQVPDVQLDIVGGDPPADIQAEAARPNVQVTGYVRDVREYMLDATALVVPLRSGGGTRLKILEGLSFGVPTVSTSVGAEGLDLVDGRHLLLGDNAIDFAAAVVRVLRDPMLRSQLSAAGRGAVESTYEWSTLTGRLHDVIDASLRRR